MNKKKLWGLIALVFFAIMQIFAFFVAAYNTSGIVSFIFYVLGGVACLFGVALDFLLLVIAVDIFGNLFGLIARGMGKEAEEEEETEQEMEVFETPE